MKPCPVVGGPHHGQSFAVKHGSIMSLPVPMKVPTTFSHDVSGHMSSRFDYRLECISSAENKIYFWVPDSIRPQDVPEHLLNFALKAKVNS